MSPSSLRCLCLTFLSLSVALPQATADGPADNNPLTVRQIPPPGITLEDRHRERLELGLAALDGLTDACRANPSPVTHWLPDVEIFHRAVAQAVRHQEMFHESDVAKADELLAEGIARAQSLLAGDAPWTRQTGLVVRGFRSKLDDTVQPYGLVIPVTYEFDGLRRHRCDLWFHGRNESTVELQFIHQRLHNVGPIEPVDTIVLHPFGRYSNAFKFAGEVDVWEALAHAEREYRIDDSRIAVRGFSMGGAGCWQFAVHYPGKFFAATPGAGFSETPEFLQSFQGETLDPPEWERTLWQLYDCPVWVANLRHCPTIAYSGELDIQKQAADRMAQAFRHDTINGLELVHLIGPQTGHQIHPDSLAEIESRLTTLAARPRSQLPERVRIETCALRYNQAYWVTINGLDRHWERAEVNAHIDEYGRILVYHWNVNDVTLSFPQGALGPGAPLAGQALSPLPISFHSTLTDLSEWPPVVPADDPRLRLKSDGSFECRFVKDGHEWRIYEPSDDEGLHKRPGLQGPIDDAFLDSFLFVLPSGEEQSPAADAWVTSELDRARRHWRQQMRGDVRVKADLEVTADDIANHNLILWGDPASNALLARLLPQLPLTWTDEQLSIGDREFDARGHIPVLIYPNPLNPARYVVVNSSFTYREYDYLNNARQTPKLPDWAIIDLSEPPGTRWPGRVAAADFFDETWQPQSP
jgi:hypothetical protein